MIGRTIGRYRILSKLGEGGMGTVWRAEDPLLQRTIALKFLPVILSDSPEARQRFLREARAASALHHSGIATVFDVGEVENQIYIAMHLVEGETLSAKLQRDALPVAEALRIAIEAGTALAHAHAHGVLHRDVSSRNIMVDHEGQVVVVDFGLAHPEGTSKLTQSGTWMGTVAYIAPEVLQGGKADGRSDVYSLGVVLYEMLTGRLPFTGERQEAVMYAAVHEEPEPPSRQQPGSPALDTVVLRALAKRPDERYGTAAELVVALRTIAAAENATRVEAAAGRMSSSPGATNRRAWTIFLAALMLMSTAFTLVLMRERRASQDGVVETQALRVAVLPLQNLSTDGKENDFLVEGIGASLATRLSKVLGATVIPWVTSRRFVDVTDLVQTATQMRVDALIVGTLRQSGEMVKVSIALVDGRTGAQRWSDEFEETFSDIFELEALIATSTAAQLKGRLRGQDEKTLKHAVSRNSEAYLRYLRGSKAMNADTPEAWDTAIEFFESALELDPELALAHVGIGAVHTARVHAGRAGPHDLNEAEKRFRHALAIDSTLHAARSGLIRVYWKRAAQEEVLRVGAEARQLVHSAHESGKEDLDAMFVAAEAFFFAGFPALAVPLFEKVLAGDPASQVAKWNVTIAYNWAGNFKAAIDAGNSYLTEFGPDAEILVWIGASHQSIEEPGEALLYYQQALERKHPNAPWLLCLSATAARDLGDLGAEHRFLEDASEMLAEHPTEFSIGAPGLTELVDIRAALEGREAILHEGERALRGEREVWNLPALHVMHGEYKRATELLCMDFRKGWAGRYFQWGIADFWARHGERLLQQPGMQECYAEFEERGRRMLEKYGAVTP